MLYKHDKMLLMELRVLRYFLAVAKEGSVSRAATALHVTQPTLSRQIMNLEDELGTQLFRRSTRATTLTEDGVYFRRRAEEIMALADATAHEFRGEDNELAGTIAVGGAETPCFSLLAKAAKYVRENHPGVNFRLYSGNANDAAERMESGVLDFALFIDPVDVSRYETLMLPLKDTWGVLMRKDSPLAEHARITPAMLHGKPLLLSSQSQVETLLSNWMGSDITRQTIVARGNLLYNLALMVQQNLGYAVTLDGIAPTGPRGPLLFRPLSPKLEASLHLAWLKSRPMSRAAAEWLACLKSMIPHGARNEKSSRIAQNSIPRKTTDSAARENVPGTTTATSHRRHAPRYKG